ncbi:phosphoglycerol transferase, partial [[Ruminococcus] lactaris]|nr:phosphoglycerol transferase [[Ruminococcus] lactaris]
LESMETTYSDVDDGGAFDENVIPELTEIAQTNEDFSVADPKLNGGYSLAGTTWTMGAMFAQTSGLPLNISISANDLDTQDSFFPGVTTLGDILSDAGYTQT